MADNATTNDQAGTPKPDMSEIASIARDIHIRMYGGVLMNTDSTLLTRGQARGLAIYDDLKRDCHAGAVLDKRRLAVVSRAWDVEPASDSRIDKKAAALVKESLKALEFDRICGNLLEAVLKGYAVGEVMWTVRGGAIVPQDIIARSAQRFAMSIDGQPRLRTRENLITGIELPDRKFIVQRFGATDDFPYGLGLGSSLFWPVMFKRQDITFWLKFVDKFGAPTAVGKYPNSASAGEKDKLLQALNAISNDAGIIVPEGMLVELLNIAATTDNYEKLARYLDEQISERVLGETMTTSAAGAGMGSNQASVHDDVRLEIAQADANMLNATLSATLARWICDFNFPTAGAPRITRDFDEPDDLDKVADRDEKLFNMGWERTEESMTEAYGPGYVRTQPEPAPAPNLATATGPDGQPLQPGQAGPGAQPGQPGQAGDVQVFAEVPASLAKQNRDAQDQLRAAATAAAEDWHALMAPRIKRLHAVLAETGDLVAFREALGKLLDEPPNDDLVERLARGSFAAHVVGRGPAKKPAPKPGLFSRLMARGKTTSNRP